MRFALIRLYVCECDLSLQEKYKRKREWIQCTNRESTPESQVHIIACHIIELFSIPPLFFAWFVTFIKCKCAIYHAHTQTHTLVWHRELRCIPMKWKMVTNSSSSINFLRFFRCSRTVSSAFWVFGLHGTSFYFRALKFVPEKRQRNDIFRIQAVFNYYFAIAMPVAIIWQKHWFCDSILSRFFSSSFSLSWSLNVDLHSPAFNKWSI